MSGLNSRTVTISNASGYGAGWTLTASGQLTTEGMTGYVEASATAAVQPRDEVRVVEGGGTQKRGVLRIWFYKNADGSWPTVRGAPDALGDELPTLLAWDGRYYEIQNTRNWKHGLRPHIYAEAEVLSLERPGTTETSHTPEGGGTDTVDW